MKRIVSVFAAIVGFIVLAAWAVPAEAQCAAPKFISGKWVANDGGTYQVKVYGTEVWWVGTSADNGATWMNVFKGTLTNGIIEGEWADVRGRAKGQGTLKLRLTGTYYMERLSGTGSGFGGSKWGRGGCADTG